MTRELIKKKHFPLAVALGLVGYFAVRYGLCDFRETTQELADRITETGLFFVIGLPGVVMQYYENKYFWSRFLVLDDDMSFIGLSAGVVVGLLSFAHW
ncbi:hypothetical protein [Marinobacter sp.]|uniref:hypothetical protein n=1 Tax=Marinobacter sp. TaxID=50741 RepID=UPI003A8F1955